MCTIQPSSSSSRHRRVACWSDSTANTNAIACRGTLLGTMHKVVLPCIVGSSNILVLTLTTTRTTTSQCCGRSHAQTRRCPAPPTHHVHAQRDGLLTHESRLCILLKIFVHTKHSFQPPTDMYEHKHIFVYPTLHSDSHSVCRKNKRVHV